MTTQPATPRQSAHRQRDGTLIGPRLSAAATARAAGVCALLGGALALLAALLTPGPAEGDGEMLWGKYWMPAAWVLGLSLFFATTWLALRTPPRWQAAAQALLALATAALCLAFLAAPAGGLPPPATWPDLLTDDYWPLIPVVFVLALPLARFGLHRVYWLRGFMLVTIAVFWLVLPDYLGVLTRDEGTRSYFGSRFGLPDVSLIELDADLAAAQRASGMVPVLFLLALLAGWLPLLGALLRRRLSPAGRAN